MNWIELYKHIKNNTKIEVVSSCVHYQRLAKQLLLSTDTVLEIGCSTGVSTRVLSRYADKVIAIETSYSVLEMAKNQLEDLDNVTFEYIDAREVGSVKQIIAEPEAIFLDIGGNIQLSNLMSVLRLYLLHFKPRIWVVRSYELAILCHLIDNVELPEESAQVKNIINPVTSINITCYLELSKSDIVNDRVFAARKLRKIKHDAARQRLKEMQQDPNSKVRKICQLCE